MTLTKHPCEIASRVAPGRWLQACTYRFTTVTASPPDRNDSAQRTDRHGGGDCSGGLSDRRVHEGLPCLRPGGRLLLLAGCAIVRGDDPLLRLLQSHLEQRGLTRCYWELGPAVSGKERDQPAGAEPIAAVALVALAVQRPAP